MNEIVKYDNVLNSLSFRGFEQRDFDLFMAICARMRDLGEEEQIFEYDYLMDLVGWDKAQGVERFHKALVRMNEKLSSIKATVILSEDEDATFVLFVTFRRNIKKRTLKVSVNKDFKFILNDISRDFTRFELKEYVALDSRYAKQLYSQIRQRYRLNKHFWQPSVEELRQTLSIPEKLKIKYINDEIIKPCIKTIQGCKGLKDLNVEILKEKRRGNPVKGYRFTWTAKDQVPGQLSFDDLEQEHDKPQKKKKISNKFKNFEERDYDFAELERRFARN